MVIKVYLDNCAYNRPFDDQTQVKIALEAIAKQHIQRLDYTEWRKTHFADIDSDPAEFNRKAIAFDKNNPEL